MNNVKIPKNIFSKKAVDYTFAVLFFLIFSVFIVFAIKPSLTTAVSLTKEEADLKKIDLLYEKEILDIITIQSQLEKNRDYLPFLNQAIPTYPQVNKMVQDIKILTDSNSFLIKKAVVSDINLLADNTDNKKRHLNRIKILVEGKSSFEEALKFINDLFDQRRLKTIKKLVVSSDSESTNSAQLKITLEIEGYYL